MKRRRSLLLALVCTLVISNTAVIFAASMESVDKYGYDYPGNIKGYVSSLICDSGWLMHRGRSYVALYGSDTEALSTYYMATSSIGYLGPLGRLNVNDDFVNTYEECTKHWYFSSVKTTLKTDKSEISITATD